MSPKFGRHQASLGAYWASWVGFGARDQIVLRSLVERFGESHSNSKKEHILGQTKLTCPVQFVDVYLGGAEKSSSSSLERAMTSTHLVYLVTFFVVVILVISCWRL